MVIQLFFVYNIKYKTRHRRISYVRYVVSVLVQASIGADTLCEDTDTKACEILAKSRPDLCTTHCLSKYCPRFCGKCPLKCFQCNEVDAPEMCRNQTMCPSQDHECIVTQTLSSNFRPVFKLGCAEKQVCDQLFGTQAPPAMTTMPPQTTMAMTTGDIVTDMTTDMVTDMTTDSQTPMDMTTTPDLILIGKRQIQGSCCNTDLCNGPTNTQTNPTIITIGKRATNSTACVEVDTDACKILSLQPNICNDACFASSCPVQCGKCSECFTCDSIENPENCTQTEICPSGEECYTLEKLRSDGTHSFQLGCLHPDVCTKLHQGATNIFEGEKSKRSDPIELSLHGACCQGSLCNHKKFSVQPMATPKPTTAPSTGACAYTKGCPTNFHSLDQHCFVSSTTEMTYNEAKEFCAKYCSSLAEFPSSDPFHAIANYYITHHRRPTSGFLFSNSIPLARDFWVGATDHGDSRHRLVWESTGKSVYPLHQTSSHVHGRTHCGIMRVDTKTNEIIPEDCHRDHRALCIADWK